MTLDNLLLDLLTMMHIVCFDHITTATTLVPNLYEKDES